MFMFCYHNTVLLSCVMEPLSERASGTTHTPDSTGWHVSANMLPAGCEEEE